MTSTGVSRRLAEDAHAELRRRGETVAVAESLTGGLLSSALVDIAGAATTFRGGVVAYASDLKSRLLGVDAELLEKVGAVDGGVAAELADGARLACAADWGVSATGAAGPEPQDGQPVGTVFVGVSGPGGTEVRPLRLHGTREAIRTDAVSAALDALVQRLRRD